MSMPAFLLLVIPWTAAQEAGTKSAPVRPPPALRYRVTTDSADAPDPRLRVDLRVTGLDPARRDVRLQLPGWGEWYDLDEYYVREPVGEPPLRHDHEFLEHFRVELPAAWDGTLHATYSIPVVALGSRANHNHGLLPWCVKSYVHFFSINTLMRVAVGEELADADRTLELVPRPGWSVMTGWSGVTDGPQTVKLAAAAENTVIVFGRMTGSARSESAGSLLEVVQFGDHEDRTQLEHDFASKLRAAYAKTTGSPAAAAERILITEPGLGGTHIEGSITMGHPEVAPDGHGGSRFELGTAHFIAHELFHAWLPGVLKNGEDRLEWVFEGFTEYWSLWHLVLVGEATPDQFADRLLWYERLARASPACGKVAFADPAVKWREPDAETVAYKGGCLLALHLDTLLRDAGNPGLPQLFRDLMQEEGGVLRRASFEKWLAAQGLEAAWAECCVKPFQADPFSDLVRVGFRAVDQADGTRKLTARGGTTEPFFQFGE